MEVDLNDIKLRDKKFDFIESPLNLIDFTNDGFKLNEDALQMIRSIEEDIIVVSVVGKARTGKSYLMNLLLDNVGKPSCFKVESSINSCTKGIWLWGNFRKKQNSNAKIIFIDSEGTSAVDRSSKTYDAKIFALIVLISSLFIYNTTSVIDESGISELSLAGHFSKSIATNSAKDKDALLQELSPKFIWLIRDFSLEKVHPETGNEISSKEYLEVCLRAKTSGTHSEDNNLIRQNILKYFHDRDCVTLVRPADDEGDIKKLNQMTLDKLKPEFRADYLELKDKVFKEANPKRFNGKKLNGPTLVNLIIEFVNAINKGAVPNINNAWDQVVQKDIENFAKKALASYSTKVNSITETMEQDELIKILYDNKFSALLSFYKCEQLNPDVITNSIYNNVYKTKQRNLESEILKLESKAIETNSVKCRKVCTEILKNSFSEIQKKILETFYSNKTLNDLNDDFKGFLNSYFEKSKGPEKLKILIEFTIEKHPELLKSLSKKIGTDNDKRINDLDEKIQNFIAQNELLENENRHLKENNDSDYQEVANLKSSLQKANKRIEELEETIKELEESRNDLLKKQAEPKYIPKTKTKRVLPNEDDDKIDEDDQGNFRKEKNPSKKKEQCHCNCLMF